MNNMQSVRNEVFEMAKKIVLLRHTNRELTVKYEAVVAELEAAQGEIDATKKRIFELDSDSIKYRGLIKSGLICNMCGGAGFVGYPPDNYYDCPECKKANDEFCSRAVQSAAVALFNQSSYEYEIMYKYADKLERGEL